MSEGKTPTLLRFANKEGLGEACAREVVACAREAIAARGKFVVALSGGSQPKILASGLLAVAGKGTMDPSGSVRSSWGLQGRFWKTILKVMFSNASSRDSF